MDLRFVLRSFVLPLIKRDNGNDHRAAAKALQAEKAARPAAPCASYCYPAFALQVPSCVLM